MIRARILSILIGPTTGKRRGRYSLSADVFAPRRRAVLA